MREQPALLEDVAEAALLRWQVDLARAVEQHLAAHGDATACRRQQAGQRIDDRGLAGARAAEQCGDAGRRRDELGGQRKRAECGLDIDLDHGAPRMRRSSRRAITSDASKAAMATMTAMTHRRNAGGSPPGTCVKE